MLRTERASLQARADSEARIGLLPAFRTAGLLLDALAVRSDSDGDRAFDLLPAFRRQAFSELDALNGALKDALDRPSEGARLAAHKAAAGAAAAARPAGGRRCAAHPVLYAALRAAAPRHRRTDAGAQCAPSAAPRPLGACAAGSAAARHTGRTGGHPGGASRAALRAGFCRGRRRRSAAADRDRRAASGVGRRPAAGAVDRCVARTGDGGARAAALFGAARGLRDRRAAHELRGGRAVRPARLAHGVVPAPVHGAARPPGFVRLRPADAHDDAGIQHPGVARDPVACAARARPARCAAASIRRPAGASTRSVSAWSSSSGWAGRTMSAIRR